MVMTFFHNFAKENSNQSYDQENQMDIDDHRVSLCGRMWSSTEEN